jgi:hypothetical protein
MVENTAAMKSGRIHGRDLCQRFTSRRTGNVKMLMTRMEGTLAVAARDLSPEGRLEILRQQVEEPGDTNGTCGWSGNGAFMRRYALISFFRTSRGLTILDYGRAGSSAEI